MSFGHIWTFWNCLLEINGLGYLVILQTFLMLKKIVYFKAYFGKPKQNLQCQVISNFFWRKFDVYLAFFRLWDIVDPFWNCLCPDLAFFLFWNCQPCYKIPSFVWLIFQIVINWFRPHCNEHFQRTCSACGCVFKEITLVGTIQGNYIENANARWKRLSQRSFRNKLTEKTFFLELTEKHVQWAFLTPRLIFFRI